MSLHLCITQLREGVLAAALYEDARLIQLSVQRSGEGPAPGTVILGLVEKHLPDLNAAFVRLGKTEGYLESRRNDLRTGMILPVQVVRPANGTKKMLLRDTLSFPWMTPASAKKLSEEIEKKAATRTVYSVLYGPEPGWMSFLSYDPDRIITDLPEVYERAASFYHGNTDSSLGTHSSVPEVVFYEDRDYPLRSAFNLTRDTERLLARKVNMSSGALLVIDRAEAFYAIDVNSGKRTKGNSRQRTLLETNLEAASEAARQIRLRNLSGMILIDFINLETAGENEELIRVLKEELAKDPAKPRFHDLTALGIAEITRARRAPSLSEVL